MFLLTLFSGPYALLARWAVLGIACLALWGHGWIKGNQHGTEKLTEYQAAQAIDAVKLIAKQTEVTEVIRTKYIDRVQTIKEKGDAIIVAVPQYITVKDDSACVINRGFQRLHDASASNISPAPGGDNDSATGLALSTTLGIVSQNYTTYHQVAARLVACQDWISAQYEASNGKALTSP